MNKLQKKCMSVALAMGSFLSSASVAFADFDNPGPGFFQTFSSLWDKLLQFVMAIGLLMVFLYLIWGGIDWITSGGDKGKTEGARNKITAAVIGLIVLAAAYAILTIVVGFLGGGDFSSYLNSAGIN